MVAPFEGYILKKGVCRPISDKCLSHIPCFGETTRMCVLCGKRIVNPKRVLNLNCKYCSDKCVKDAERIRRKERKQKKG